MVETSDSDGWVLTCLALPTNSCRRTCNTQTTENGEYRRTPERPPDRARNTVHGSTPAVRGAPRTPAWPALPGSAPTHRQFATIWEGWSDKTHAFSPDSSRPIRSCWSHTASAGRRCLSEGTRNVCPTLFRLVVGRLRVIFVVEVVAIVFVPWPHECSARLDLTVYRRFGATEREILTGMWIVVFV